MKSVFLISLIFFFTNNSFSLQRIPIQEALKNQKVEVDFSYINGNHHKSIFTTIENKTTNTICVEINPGTLLESDHIEFQNHLITKYDTIHLKPKEKRNAVFSGMCCESKDKSPVLHSKFKIIDNKNNELVQLCYLIDSLKLYGYEAQTAIWALANKSTPNRITGEDSTDVMALRCFVGQKLNIIPEIYQPYIYLKKVRQLPTLLFNNDGTMFVDSLTTNDQIVLELYDAESDVKIKSIPHERIYIQKGTLNLFLSQIKLDNLLVQTSYVIRLKKNGIVCNEWMYIIS